MKGSLQIKNGKYYAVFNIKKSDGKKTTKWISTGFIAPKEKKKAEKYLNEIINKTENDSRLNQEEHNSAQANNEQLISTLSQNEQLKYKQSISNQQLSQKQETLLYQFIIDWLDLRKSDVSIDSITYEYYESLCNKHIIPYFKKHNTILEKVSYKDIQEYIDYEASFGNQRTKEGLSPTTLGKLKKVLSQVFKNAKKERIITDNPCEYVKLPKQVKKEYTIMTLDQLSRFLSGISNERLYPIIYLTALYGLRRSEILGIKWDSINYEQMTLTIKHTYVEGKKIYEKDTTKNDSSYRTYPISPAVKDLFEKQKQDEQRNKKFYGADYIENDYVFKWENGEPYNPSYITRKFSQLLEENDMPHIRFHDLRHSCASYLVSSGFQLKDIQEWLGHADIDTTANIYAHLYFDRKSQILTSLDLGVTESDSE